MEVKMDGREEEMEAQMASLASWIKENTKKFEVLQGTLISRMDAHHESMTASVNAWCEEMKADREVTEACLEKMQACLYSKVPNPEEMQSRVEHQEIPKEHAAMKPIRGLRKRHRGWHLATGRQSKPEERTWGNCRSRKKLAAVGRKMTRCTGVTLRKVHVIR
jgi:hypothetical protein